MENKEKSKISLLLERLQEESWQLELLISGFAIFLVAGSWEFINDFMRAFQIKAQGSSSAYNFMPIFLMGILGSWFFLLTNLIMHVFLRGLWISAIGLRYISGDVDFDTLNFSPRFDSFLRKRITNFDDYIEKIEKICSMVFAFTFMLVFMLISLSLLSLFFIVFNFGLNYIFEGWLNESVLNFMKAGFSIAFAIGFFLYFIDFITLGWLKRRKKFSIIYYPIYRFCSWVTLSRFYRPLYYNMIDNKFGKAAGFLLVPYLFIGSTIATIKNDSFLYFPEKEILENRYYLENIGENKIISKPAIPSKIIKDSYLELFIPYRGIDDKAIAYNCPNLRPPKSIGPKTTIIQFNADKNSSPVDSLLSCVASVNRIMINDSLYEEIDFDFYVQPVNNEHGLLTMIDINHLDRGKHILTVLKLSINKKDSASWKPLNKIPFWKELNN